MILFIILSLIFNFQISNGAVTTSKSSENRIIVNTINLNQEPNENQSLPYLLIQQSSIEFGNKTSFEYGMKDVNTFIAGYNYSLYLISERVANITTYNITGNSLKLENGITTNNFTIYNLPTVENSVNGNSIVTPPGDYTILFQVNSTNRGLLNATGYLEVRSTLEANVLTIFKIDGSPTGSFTSAVNRTTPVTIEIRNVGQSDAFNVTIDVKEIDQPLGLRNLPSLPRTYPSLVANESETINITIEPDRYGIGHLSLKITYVDANASLYFKTGVFTVTTLPAMTGRIIIQSENGAIQSNLKLNASVITSNITIGNNAIVVNFKLSSDIISFSPPDGHDYKDNIVNYQYWGTPIQIGVTQISLTITYIDTDGVGTLSISPDTRTIEVVGPVVTSQEQNPVLASILILYTMLMILVIIFYFRTDVRNRFFSRILGVQFVQTIKFPSSSVIIDGSNVAWEEYSITRKAKLDNILLAIKTLKEAGISEIIIIADASLRYQIDKKDELDKMVSQGIIKLTPAKVDADGLILRLAADTGSLILSNDLYKQHREEYNWIDSRRIPYTIINSKIYLHPLFEKKTKSANN